jgi:putative spermidine/putrescine transport system substrate-binding protein
MRNALVILALFATGVAPKDIYALLSTPEGVSRAFAKLDTIRASIVWWKSANEPLAMLADGRAALTTALNGKVADAIARDHRNLRIIWDGQRYELDVFGIPRGTLNKDNALAFIRFATGTEPLTQVRGLLPYGPARLSALHSGADNPTTHVANGIYVDPNWWSVHGPAIEARWREWRAQP